jgi:flagellar basal body-associated protein FliL
MRRWYDKSVAQPEQEHKVNKKKPIIKILIVVIFGLMLCASVIFLLASSIPSGYNPIRLNQQERELFAKDFIENHGLEFINKVGENKAFTHEISQDELNLYLASLEEIAFLKPGKAGEKKKSGEVCEAMDKAGLADPVVIMDDGVITIMVRTKGSNKVLSIDISMQITDDERLAVGLDGVRVGRMPLPTAVLNEGLATLKKSMTKRDLDGENSAKDLDGLLATLLASINEEPITTEMKFRRKVIRKIVELNIEDGKLTMHVVPVDYKTRQ